ncbi:MAG: hypothetical protein JO128_16455, partial [Alphaproteobacteria bacterium]|nr:hypothetical protein [Alphaproteobacteria bacterium]
MRTLVRETGLQSVDMTTHVHLVGGIGLDTVEEVFAAIGQHLGARVKRVPDGEVGARRDWFSWQQIVLRLSPFLESDKTALQPFTGGWMIKVAGGVKPEDIRFGELGYAREARASYEDFKAAQRRGVLPAAARFQVSLPTPFAVATSFCVRSAWPAVVPAYERAMFEDVKRLCDHVPHQDLAIQWDASIEMLMWDGRLPVRAGFPDMERTFRSDFARLARAVPPEVQLGYHLCYGDPDGKHMIEPADCTKMVELANLIVE